MEFFNENKRYDGYRDLFEYDEGFRSFCEQADGGKSVHAYIIECKDKILYPDLLKACASEILGYRRGEKGDLLVFGGTHPDVSFYPADGRKRLSAEDVRSVLDDANTKPTLADKKVFCLGVEQRNDEIWQNKLLKLLEEPPRGVFILIAVANAQELLPTVRSRCQTVKMGEFEEKAVADYLNKNRNVSRSEAEIAARLSRGSIAKALYVSGGSGYLDCVSDVVDLFCNMKSTKTMADFLPTIAKYKDRYEDFFEIIENVLFDAVLININASQVLNLFKKDDIMKIAEFYPREALLRAIPLVEEAKKRLDGYGSFAVVTDNLFLRILEVRYLCRQ